MRARLHKRRALLIGNEHYDDGRFSSLASVRADVWGLAQVLKHHKIGNFVSVQTESDLAADDMRAVIGEFLQERDEDELALVYVSGHGVRTVRDGSEFHFVARDTDYDRVSATGVSAGFLKLPPTIDQRRSSKVRTGIQRRQPRACGAIHPQVPVVSGSCPDQPQVRLTGTGSSCDHVLSGLVGVVMALKQVPRSRSLVIHDFVLMQ